MCPSCSAEVGADVAALLVVGHSVTLLKGRQGGRTWYHSGLFSVMSQFKEGGECRGSVIGTDLSTTRLDVGGPGGGAQVLWAGSPKAPTNQLQSWTVGSSALAARGVELALHGVHQL